MKKHFTFGDNYIRFDCICAVRASIRLDQDEEVTDSVSVFMVSGHELGVPLEQTQNFLRDWREYLKFASTLPTA